MEIATTLHPNGVAVLRLTGGLDIRSADTLKQQLSDTIASGHTRLVVDLGGVGFMDSSGLGALISGLKRAVATGGDLRLANVSQQVRMVIELAGLQSTLRRYGSVADALASYT